MSTNISLYYYSPPYKVPVRIYINKEEYIMDKQEIFNKVAQHLLRQGSKALTLNMCRLLDHKGRQCAIGCLIPRELYDHHLESYGFIGNYFDYNDNFLYVPNIFTTLLAEKVGIEFTKDNYELLRALQHIHDHWDINEWKLQLKSCAIRFNLSSEVI